MRLVEEFGPELQEMGERLDDVTGRVEVLEARRDRTQFHGDILHRSALISNSGGGPGTDPEDLDWSEDIVGVTSARLRIDHSINENSSARLTYWEIENTNRAAEAITAHGRENTVDTALQGGIDEAWISTEGWGGEWTVGKFYVGDHVALEREADDEDDPLARWQLLQDADDERGRLGSGLLFYNRVALAGIQFKTELGGLDVTGVGQHGAVGDAMGVFRAGLDVGNLDLGANYLHTGHGGEKGFSVDASFELFGNREVFAEWAQMLEDVNENEPDNDDTVLVVGVDDILSTGTFQIGAKWGKLEENYDIQTSIINRPFLLDPLEDAFDRPLFLDPANVAEGFEVEAGITLANTPIRVRFYDGDDINGDDASAVTTISLTRPLSKVANLELMYGLQSDTDLDGDGVENEDLSVARAQVSLGF
jgi:hypothetical protein